MDLSRGLGDVYKRQVHGVIFTFTAVPTNFSMVNQSHMAAFA
jgi:hypothetical protein